MNGPVDAWPPSLEYPSSISAAGHTRYNPPGQRALVELLTDLPQSKILVTHDTPFAKAICTRAVFFHAGVISAEGPVEDIASRFGWDLSLEGTKSRH